jgi:hypothetical protein
MWRLQYGKLKQVQTVDRGGLVPEWSTTVESTLRMRMATPFFLRPVETPRAIVLVLGPLGVSMRSLEQMADLYPDCSVVAASSPPCRFILNQSLSPTAQEILRSAQNMLTTSRATTGGTTVPIVTHAFSNGGAFLLDAIEQTLRSGDADHTKMTTTGTRTDPTTAIDVDALRGAMSKGFQLFDSCPCYIRLLWDWQHLNDSFPHPQWSRTWRWLYTMGASLSLTLWSMCTGAIGRPCRFWNAMKQSDLCLHQIYIYSKCDMLSDAAAVERLVTYRTSVKQADCIVHAYDDSGHCRLHIDHQQEYSEAIEAAMTAMEGRKVPLE